MFGILGGLLSAVSTGLSIFGGITQEQGKEQQSKALLEEEAARKKQMTLDFQRQRLEAVRGAIISSSLATAAAVNQGALRTSSYISGKSSITAEKNFQIEGLNQNEAIGNEVFDARKDYYNAGGTINFGQGLSSLGGAIAGNIDNLSRIGNLAFGGGSSQASSSAPTQYSSNQAVTIGSIP